MSNSNNPAGMLQPSTAWGIYNNLLFMIQQQLAKVQTATLVQVKACSNDGGVSPVGTVDVQILVNQMSGNGASTPHVTMYGLPYLRIQGGANAVIMDPQAGDIGIAVFASRDITNVKSTKAQSNPGSWRMHDFSDGMYLGGLLNGAPSQYVQFTGTGISFVSPATITLEAPNVTVDGSFVVNTLPFDTLQSDVTTAMSNAASALETANNAAVITVNNTAPASPSKGDIWYNTSTTPDSAEVWNGTAWVAADSAAQAQAQAANALADDAQGLAGTKAKVTISNTAPASPNTGDIWINDSVTPQIVDTWTGTAWILASDITSQNTSADSNALGGTPAATVLANLSSALESADGKATITIAATAPASPSVGDIWYNTSVSPDAAMIWNGAAWVAADSAAQAQASNAQTLANDASSLAGTKAKVTIGSTAPSSPNKGDIWINDAASPYQVESWTGSAWVLYADITSQNTSADTTAVSGQPSATVAQGATGVNTNFVPDSSMLLGDAYWTMPNGAGFSLVACANTGTNAVQIPQSMSGKGNQWATSGVFILQAGVEYTLSAYINAIDCTVNSPAFVLYNPSISGGAYASLAQTLGKDGRVSTTFTMPTPSGYSAGQPVPCVLIFDSMRATMSADAYGAAPMIQAGSIATAYIPNILDNQTGSFLYGAMCDEVRTAITFSSGNVNNLGGTAAATVLSQLAGVITTADAKAEVTIATTAPSSPAVGDIWYNTSFSPDAAMIWNGSAWVAADSAAQAQASNAQTLANDASSLAGTKAKVTIGSTAPSSPNTGDIWINDAASPYQVNTWNGSAWTLSADITSQNTSNDTNNVNGVSSGSISPIGGLMPGEAYADATNNHLVFAVDSFPAFDITMLAGQLTTLVTCTINVASTEDVFSFDVYEPSMSESIFSVVLDNGTANQVFGPQNGGVTTSGAITGLSAGTHTLTVQGTPVYSSGGSQTFTANSGFMRIMQISGQVGGFNRAPSGGKLLSRPAIG